MRIDIYRRVVTGSAAKFERVAVTERATDITMPDTLYSKGEWEFKMALGAPYARVVQKDMLICADNYYWGVVTKIEKSRDSKGGEIRVSGVDLKYWITSGRIVIPTDYTTTDGTAGYDTATGYTDAVVKHFWRNNITAPPQEPRKIIGVSTTAAANIGLADDKYMSRFESLAEVTETLCENAKIGYRADVNTKTGEITLDCFTGVDRTKGQTANRRAIFSVDRRNIASISYDVDRSKYANAFYTTRSGAEFADEALTLLYFRDDAEVSDWARRETWNELSVPEPISGSEYEEMKKQAVKKMEDAKEEEAYTCAIQRNAGYRTIWGVGDTVTVDWPEEGITADMQITAVTVSQDSKGTDYTVKFGESKPKFVAAGSRIIKI